MLLAGIEQRLDGRIDLAESLINGDDEAEDHNPFDCVGTLADHMLELLAAG